MNFNNKSKSKLFLQVIFLSSLFHKSCLFAESAAEKKPAKSVSILGLAKIGDCKALIQDITDVDPEVTKFLGKIKIKLKFVGAVCCALIPFLIRNGYLSRNNSSRVKKLEDEKRKISEEKEKILNDTAVIKADAKAEVVVANKRADAAEKEVEAIKQKSAQEKAGLKTLLSEEKRKTAELKEKLSKQKRATLGHKYFKQK